VRIDGVGSEDVCKTVGRTETRTVGRLRGMFTSGGGFGLEAGSALAECFFFFLLFLSSRRGCNRCIFWLLLTRGLWGTELGHHLRGKVVTHCAFTHVAKRCLTLSLFLDATHAVSQ
jgi:hypothetical protein